VQSGKTIQYVFVLEYFRNYKTLCDRKNLAGGRGGPLTTGGGALCHGIDGTMVNPALTPQTDDVEPKRNVYVRLQVTR